MADGTAPTDAACEAHCGPPEQAGNAADVRLAALASPSVLVLRVVLPVTPTTARAMPPLAHIASPPLSLLFGRFLI